ncbi:AraC family transcriptional regulator [Motiliproteus coralliicola]|uniref:AraC family transcriptional regulator n=1 Tax=Motiliproteus coralliicola TaxID=2283196 RepID=A0A369WDZ7_9GAMM|nr:AraC family transcriptional regulator [Motiliproteus coralliicola]RDE19523.1 AraC family transcriptional regulator [Motiliproteus coralliicola]
MAETASPLTQLRDLIDRHAPHEGLNETPISQLVTFRGSESYRGKPTMYEPMLILAAQGQKFLYLEGKQFAYGAGQLLAIFTPMAFECEVVGASPDQPMLGMAICLDRHRLASLLLKMEQVQPQHDMPEVDNSSAVFSAPIGDKLMQTSLRLLQCLDDPAEASVLGESIIDEVYYRILSDERGGALKVLLRQQGPIQQISRVVEYLHENLDQTIAVDELAATVNMSVSGFHKKFKEVMHLSPLQYTKLIRLNKAQTYLMAGHSVSEAGYRVGYNSPAQFSREYKRQFGTAPSAMLAG